MDLFHLHGLMLFLMALGIALLLRECFWNPWLLWGGRVALRLSGLGLLSILFHAGSEGRMDWAVSLALVLATVFLLESIILWAMTGRIQAQQWPAVLRYEAIKEKISWPIHWRFRALRNYFRREHFQNAGCFRLSFLGTPLVLNVVLLDASRRIRLEVFFHMGPRGIRQLQCALSSRVGEKEWLVTNNGQLPLGGWVPAAWRLKRYGFASPQALLRRHRRRLQRLGVICEAWEAPHLLETLHREQEFWAEENLRRGFLEKSSDGRQYVLSDEGRYRLWKSLLCRRTLGLG
ncbi:MAG: hypothetical protein LBD54_00065 [Puniceicoccales bacterium]|nr:hypothetical protein [Puniceicoccales bacterium]